MSYLKNAWYCAAWASEINTKPLARTFLDERVALFRDSAGAPVAFADRCPHRFAPLSKGKVIENTIECTYHGLRFGSDGRCVSNPHGPIPKAATVRIYPVIERYNLIWIWMGDQSTASDSMLPNFDAIADHENYAIVRGYLHLRGNYQLGSDNLLDLSHAQFLHSVVGSRDPNLRTRFTTKTEGNTVCAYNDMPGEAVTQMWKIMWPNDSAVCDRRAYMRWDPPANMFLDIGVTKCGRPASEGPSLQSGHFLTPETEKTTHYFWVAARDSLRDDPGLSETIRANIDTAFRLEDEPMIEACQDRIGCSDLMSLNPVLLPIDAAAGRTRSILAKLIHAEQNKL